MIKAHIKFLLTTKIHKIILVTALIVGVVLYSINEYKTPQAELLFFQDYYELEFIQQGGTIIKFIVLLFITMSWIYATKISNYRVYLCIRYHPVQVLFTQYVVLIGLTVFLTIPLITTYIILWNLYPVTVSMLTVSSIFITYFLWIIIYHTLCWLMEVVFHHPFALVIPLLGYFFGMVSMGIISDPTELENKAFYSQLLFPDIIYVNNHFILRFGGFVHLSTLIVCLLIIYSILQKKDYNTYL